ncbi:MAG: hypothetical protein ABEK84_10565 [Salinibacter sp.]
MTLTWGCDFSSPTKRSDRQTFSPTDIAVKHNQMVSQTLEKLHSTKQRQGDSFELNRKTIENALQQTQTYADLNQGAVTNRSLSNFKRHLREKRGLSKKATAELGIEDLHRADMLSDAQMEYIHKIRGLENASDVRRIAKNASRELGKAATIVKIYAATYYNSLSYWRAHSAKVKKLDDDRFHSKGDIDWSAVAGADAAGATLGALEGAWAAIQSGAATATLTFGPQGAVIMITGAAISGAVTRGAGASVVTAVTMWAS